VVPHADRFKVADYGAVGDGKTDDGPAIREAVAAAVAAGPGARVVFAKRTYRMARYKGGSPQIALKDISGLTLEGNGAEIINNPYNPFLVVNNCDDVTMRGFVFDCDPLGFTQGDIVRTEPTKGEIWLKIHDGYVNPVKLSAELGKKAWNRVGFTIEADKRRLKPGPIDFVESITDADPDEDLLRVKLTAETFSHIRAGDRFVIGLLYGGSGPTIHVTASANIRLENYTIHSSKFGMNHVFTNNRGRVHVKGGRITFRPGSNNLVTSIKDGFHVKHNAIGPIIEDCLLEGMMDDSINISVCPYWVVKEIGDNRYLITATPREGDMLMAFTPRPGTVTHGLKVVSVEPQETPRGYPRHNHFSIIALDKPIPDLGLFQGRNTFPGGPEKLPFTGLYNIDASGKDYIIRNNRFLAQRRHGVLARTTGGLIEGNTFDSVGGCGIELANEIGSFYEGPFPGQTVIRNNTFRNTVWNSIQVRANGNNAWARDITIKDNTFIGWPGSAMRLTNIDGGIIEGNTIKTGAADPSGSVPIIVKDSKNLTIKNNTIADNRPDLAGVYDLAAGVDQDSLVMEGNREKLHRDFPIHRKHILPGLVQLRGEVPRLFEPNEKTGAACQRGMFLIDDRRVGGWSLHPPWRDGAHGTVLFDLPMDLSRGDAIRFLTKGTGKGDGVVLTISCKPVGAADEAYRACYQGTIDADEWTVARADIKTKDTRVVLRFSFDCGPADNTAHDTVQIAGLELLE
jgi:hypothetical protein